MAQTKRFENRDDALVANNLDRDSGIRPVAKRVANEPADLVSTLPAPPSPLDAPSPDFSVPNPYPYPESNRNPATLPESKRPTLKVSSAADLAPYLQAPPTIREIIGAGPTARPTMKMSAVSEAQLRAVAPVKITEQPDSVSRGKLSAALRRSTLRVRLTPYAKEHARADGERDDTPASMLEYYALIGPLDRVPYVRWSAQQMLAARLDHRDGFVLSRIDGKTDIDTLLDFCPMPTHRALRILYGLSKRGVVGFR
jgi:hypothetical protein